MAELFLSAVLPVLLEKLTSPELLDFATREGIGSKLNKLKKKFELINALLIDAETKQLTDRAVKMWLDELQDLAYDAEDILDEYATEALTRKLKIEGHQASTSRARKLIPACCVGFTPSALRSNFRMGSEIDDITSRLTDIYNERTGLGLEIKNAGGRSGVSLQRPPTTCFPTEPVVHGRDEDKAKILEMLRNETSDAAFGVVPIVGMGGLGKTTLAQQVYNDKAVGDFNLKAWVCVSDDSDVTRISKAILESITGHPCDLKDLNTVQSHLVKEVDGKRFLLVLDDVWSEDDDLWEKLKAPFMCGAPGSKMIVTTRLQEVAKTVRLKGGYMLDLLSDDDCWSLFMQYAFDGRDDVTHWNVEVIRQKVVQKCNGLPLAAKTLGGLLRRKELEAEWMEILDNVIWDSSRGDKILPILRLSYYHLPSNLKRCFAYCAIFPKDYEFEERELVFLWMAEGLIQQSEDNEPLEKIGGEYIHDLVSRSIFQISSSNRSKFIMHDLFNDLAQMISGKLSFRLEGGLKYSNNQSKIYEKTRYSSYICHYYNDKSKFEVFNNAKLLRTHLSLKPKAFYLNNCYLSNSVMSDLLLKFKRLRVLSLQRYKIIELPNSIGGLRHLRYLNLSYSGIISVPESVNSMCNLQTFLLRNCHALSKLPSNMGDLINLRHLDILGASLIEKMPLGIRRWKFIRTLSNFIVGKNLGSSLNDLKHLKFICGQLHISRLENVIDVENTQEIILSDKKDLKVLILEWRYKFDDSQDEEVDKKVLNMLQPHENLEELTIKCYSGTKFPSWVGDHNSFSKMTVLTLEGCMKCTSLPSLGLLGSLKDLTVRKMSGLKSIGSEFYGEGSSNTFQSLETLCFEDLKEWERWDPVKGSDGVESFPKLGKLSVVGCPKLSGTLPNNLSLLEKLVIHKCAELVVLVSTFPMLCKLEIDECKKIVFSNPTGSKSLNTVTLSNVSDFGKWKDFRRVEVLRVDGCDELINLDKLEIWKCLPLRDQFSATLSFLTLKDCSKLTTLLLPVALKHLIIKNCPELTTLLPRGQLPETLEMLQIRGCVKLESIVERFYNNTALYNIWISCCENLKSIPDGIYTLRSLRAISIVDCGDLVSFPKGGLPNSILQVSISDCEKLKALPSRIHTLTSLQHLDIFRCPSLSYPEEGLPANLSFLRISSPNLYKPLTNLGFHNLTSLKQLKIHEFHDAESFHEVEMEMTLPPTLTSLWIEIFPKLKCLSFKSLENLTSLESLWFRNCPELTSLPNLPSSLLQLYIIGCPSLKEACKKDEGKEWYKIVGIPHVEIDYKFIYKPILKPDHGRKIIKLSEGEKMGNINNKFRDQDMQSASVARSFADQLMHNQPEDDFISGLLSGGRDFILLQFNVVSWSSWCSFFFRKSHCGSMF